MVMTEEYLHYVDPLDRRVSFVRTEEGLQRVVNSFFKEHLLVKPDSMRFAVFGDAHGHITLMLHALHDWVQYSNCPVDAILQVGDIGAHDDLSALDTITEEISRKDPDELGFKGYFYGSDEADRFFGEQGTFSGTAFYFIAGNHDDRAFLESSYDPDDFQIGHYENLHYIPSGKTVRFDGGDFNVLVAALGWNHSSSDIRRLRGKDIDILLTHIPPFRRMSERDGALSDFIESERPKNVFFGHTHDSAPGQSETSRNTYGLRDVQADRVGGLISGSLGILEISRDRSGFFYVPELPR
ncbi:MAG: metallophosphoesterase [Candidatus Nanoarchaeia archaeon]